MSQIRMFPMIWNANGDIINGRDLGKKKKCNDNRTRHVNFPVVKEKKIVTTTGLGMSLFQQSKKKLQRQPNSACHFSSSRRILNEGNGHGDVSNGRDLEKEKEKCNDNRTRHVTLPAVGGYWMKGMDLAVCFVCCWYQTYLRIDCGTIHIMKPTTT